MWQALTKHSQNKVGWGKNHLHQPKTTFKQQKKSSIQMFGDYYLHQYCV